MTVYHVEWRPSASADLRAVIQYIGKDNAQRARLFGKEIRSKVGMLEQHPYLGKASRLPGLLELVVHRNYIVFYRVQKEAWIVEILRVKHAAQQIP